MGAQRNLEIVKAARSLKESRNMNEARVPAEADQDAATDLKLFIDSDSQLYFGRFLPIIKNLTAKKARGVYDHDLSLKLWMYLIEAGAKQYVKAMGETIAWHEMFSIPTRQLVAQEYAKEFEEGWEDGNFDEYIPKKYQGKKEGAKRFRVRENVGKAQHTISFHDGKSTHKDGSDFFDIRIFRNKKDLEQKRKELLSQGYVEE